MSKFSKILILVCRKIFSAFLNETFSNSCGFRQFSLFSPHLVFYERKHFRSILTEFEQLFTQQAIIEGSLRYDLKNVVFAKHFPKMQKQPFADVLQNRCS